MPIRALPGRLIDDRYEICHVLGEGSMSTVVKVRDRRLNNSVIALKIIDPRYIKRDPSAKERLVNEVVLARSVSHPNVTRIHDIGDSWNPVGLTYISMEYLEGVDLGKFLSRAGSSGLPFSDAIKILFQVLHGVAHAHENGVVHRDLKPGNIIVTTSGYLKVCDFGLARTINADHSVTMSGDAVGSPRYMAPEQFRGEVVDTRCDIYTLGIIAYELIVGEAPFDDPVYLKLAEKHMTKSLPDFPPSRTDIPDWFIDGVRRSSAKDPNDRFQSVDQILDLLVENMPELRNSRMQRQSLVRRHEIEEPRILVSRPLKKVLIVEDNEAYRRLLEVILSKYAECEIITDGIDAAAKFASALKDNEMYDLVTLDVGLPRMSGLSVLSTIREMEQDQGISQSEAAKVMMLTNADDREVVSAAFERGCESFYRKPIEQDSLLERITELGFVLDSKNC